ncbi:HEAT repeat domain-containing protein [Bacillus salitolerans]|uniref:HEAT repeat domain-containing protein n=1 Tax=Bacillus salitolerans TaxID=1437434 RepID=A0ABW4LNP5_9BACI
MYNFVHEVGSIKNRELRYFIGNDYFHDGAIHKIEFVNEEVLEIVVSCEREWVADYNLTEGYSPESIGYDQRFNEKYMYRLKFLDCKLFETNISENGLEYINGRFKDTARLQQIKRVEKKEHFHFRMQLSGGYVDIIFGDFTIEKVNGEGIPLIDIGDIIPFSHALNTFKDVPIEEVRNESLNGDWLDRYLAIQYLSEVDDTYALVSAMKSLNHEDDEVKLSAVHVLGKYANRDVVPTLFQMWLKSDEVLFKKHIMDNIEKIHYRTNLSI